MTATAPPTLVEHGQEVCAFYESRVSHWKHTHVVICADAAGDLTGAFVDRKGHVICAVTGTYDQRDGCVHTVMDVCGERQEACS